MQNQILHLLHVSLVILLQTSDDQNRIFENRRNFEAIFEGVPDLAQERTIYQNDQRQILYNLKSNLIFLSDT